MGKKKSKVNKQKQAKVKSVTAKHKSTSNSYGVPVQKGGNKNSKLTQSITKPLHGNFKDNHKSVTKSKESLGKIIDECKTDIKVISRIGNPSQEDQDFQKEFASLQERHHVTQLRNAKQKKGNRNKRNNSNTLKGDSPSNPLQFQTSNLDVLFQPRTTEQLVHDTADKLNTSLNGIGLSNMSVEMSKTSMNSVDENVNSQTSNLLQILAAQKRNEMMLQQRQTDQKKDNCGDGNNFWALQDNDSDDEEGGNNPDEKQKSIPVFDFAPPSFTFNPTSFSSSTTTPVEGTSMYQHSQIQQDYDPDL